jgi:acyl dehydratase
MAVKELHYGDLTLEEGFPEIEHEVSQEVIDRAAMAHLDFNPVHTNIDWNTRAQVFGMPETAGHGMLTMSMMASVIDRHWRAAGAQVIRMETKLVKPVRVGRRVRCSGVIRELHPREPGKSFVVVAVNATDDEGDTVGVGNYSVRVPD